MNVGELFISLGVKGSEKTVGAISSVVGGLKDISSTSLETKAALLGALYVLERMFATSGAAGTGLTNFNASLGVTAKTLQQYQYAARQMGVSNQEVEGSFRSLQAAMTKTLMGHGAPAGLARVAKLTGEISRGDILKFQQNPDLLIQRLQEYAKKEKNAGLRNETLKSFGQGDGMIAALARGGFSQAVLSRAPIYGDRELQQLDRANIAWSNLGTKIEMAIGHFNAMHGGQLVNDLTKITTQVIRLVEELTKLADKVKVFAALNAVLGGIVSTLGLLNIMIGEATGQDTTEDRKSIGGNIGAGLNARDKVDKAIIGFLSSGLKEDQSKMLGAPEMSAQLLGGKSGATQNINVNQNLNFQHDGKDHKKTSDSVKHAVRTSFYQISAKNQWA